MMKWSVALVLSRTPGRAYGLASLKDRSARISDARVGLLPALYIARTNVCAFAKP